MNRFEIFYTTLIGLLNNIVASIATNRFYPTLNPARAVRFSTLTEPIILELREIRRRKRNDDIYENFEHLNTCVDNFNSEFNDFPNLRINQIKTVIAIC